MHNELYQKNMCYSSVFRTPVLITFFTSNLSQPPLQQRGASPYHLAWAVSVLFDLSASLVNLLVHWLIRPVFHLCFRSRPSFLFCAPYPASVSPQVFHGSLLHLHNNRHLPLPVQSISLSHICLFFLHTSLGPSTFSLPAPSNEVRRSTSNIVSSFLIPVPGSVLSIVPSIPQLKSGRLSQTVLGWAICRNNIQDIFTITAQDIFLV